jgi:2',3'-cyclic-nucleotide 2'-phosphodiesterase (5'-nucleotidase family)
MKRKDVPEVPQSNQTCQTEKPQSTDSKGSRVHVRIFHINDVYELDEFPSLRTLVKESIDNNVADKVLFTLAGDFIAPSLLASIDAGIGMIRTMKTAGVTHVCFGNHECDISNPALRERIKEFVEPGVNKHQGVWLNSNMLGYKSHVPLPIHATEKITSKDGSHTRNIALIGLLVHSPNTYRSTAFDGAFKSITPVNETAISLNEKLKGEHDLVIPLTHQLMEDDRKLGKTGIFPLILGAHDHDDHEEKYDSGSVVLKSGMDAHKVYVIDIVWANKETQKPEITYKLVSVADSKPDPETLAEVQKHAKTVKALEIAVLYNHHELLTSKLVRFHSTSMGTLISTFCREELGCDIVLLDAGSIRGEADYPDGKFTFSDLKKELPYSSGLNVIELPGKVISELVKHSRLNEDKVEYAGYFQVDDGVTVDPVTHEVTHIGKKPLVPDQIYSVGIDETSVHGMNKHTPLTDWYSTNPKIERPPIGVGIPANLLLIRNLCKRIWKKLPTFDAIDTDKNQLLSKEEIYNAYLHAFGDANQDNQIDDMEREAANIMVQNLLTTLDKNGDNQISKDEYEIILSTLIKN